MKRVSIKDIAQKAGVVPSTVSLVLNGKAKEQRISDEVAERIRRIADETGYRPLQTAVSLRKGYSKTLGLIVEDISNVFFATLAKAIEEEAYARGYKIVYCSTENDNEKGRELIAMLTSQQVDGFLITPTPDMEKEIRQLRKPVVLMDRYFPGLELPSVLVDNFEGTKLGMEHLLETGYRNIGLITVDLNQIQMMERERGYRETLELRGINVEESNILRLPYHSAHEPAVEAIRKFLKANDKLDAVFFATNYLGVCGLEAIQQLKWKIPGRLAVVCFDDHDLFRLFSPGITIIRQPIRDIAKSALQLLMRQLDKLPAELPKNYLKPPEMIIRGST